MATQTQFQAGIEAAFNREPRHSNLPLHTEDRSAWQDGFDHARSHLVKLRDRLRESKWKQPYLQK